MQKLTWLLPNTKLMIAKQLLGALCTKAAHVFTTKDPNNEIRP